MPKLSLFALIGLAGCVAAPAERITIDQQAGTCDASAIAALVGQLASQENARKLMEISRARSLRWVPPGGMVTMDFSPDRLTVQLDGQNRIESAKCG